MKRRIALVLLSIVLCFGIAYAAVAESPIPAKQLMIMKLKDTNFGVSTDFNKHSSGTATYELKSLGGSLVPKEAPFTNLAGTKLALDYKFNSPAKLLEANYKVTYNKENYGGSIYMTGDRVILSTEIVSLLQALDPSSFDEEPLPQYIYFSDKQIAAVWDALIKSKGQSVPPEFKDLLIFAVESVPDKYFTTSLTNGKVVFSLDRNGFPDVVYSFLEKVKNEKERFAGLMASTAVAYAPGEDAAKIREEILRDIDRSIQNGTFPTREKVEAALGENLVLEDFTIESSLTSPGKSSVNLVLVLGGDTGLDGKITFNADGEGGKDNFSGTYVLALTATNKKQGMTVNGKMDGKYSQIGDKMTSSGLITLNAGPMLYFALQADSSVMVDKDVQIKIPVLTPFNSVDGKTLGVKPAAKPRLKVVLDGKAVAFDVDPFIQDGRTMVPIRNLAEQLGFEVAWTPPNQIKMTRGGKTIVMYLNQGSYTADGVKKKLDVPPCVKDGRTIVPIRFIAEEFGCQVNFDAKSNTVYVNSK